MPVIDSRHSDTINTQKDRVLQQLLFLLYLIFLASMIGSFRAVTSISMAVLLLFSLLQNKQKTGKWANPRLKNPFFLACCFYFLMEACLLLIHPIDWKSSLQYLEGQLPIVIVPLIACLGRLSKSGLKRLMQGYILMLVLFFATCLAIACYRYFSLRTTDTVFFYHALVSPFKQHAVYVSILFYFGLLYLLDLTVSRDYMGNKKLHYLSMFWLTAALVLLSSKLVIAFMVFTFIYYLALVVRRARNAGKTMVLSMATALVLTALVLLTNNPVNRRFTEIFHGQISLVEQPKFDPGIYFNGLQFRLLEWRLVKDILQEHHAWITGVGTNAQPYLNQKYISLDMYTGERNEGTTGFIGYNTHNQFLESLLRFGILGLLAFIGICVTLLVMAFRTQRRMLWLFAVLLILFCLNESVLERQYGMILYSAISFLLIKRC